LRQLVAEKGALEPELVLELAKQMAEILTFLHSKQIIHRDFTPDNLIMQENGKLKLIDFNVAREWDKDDGKTGTIVGKHAYVPPEQFRGKPCEASDIYALGATLFYLTTGEDPEPISQSSLEQVNNQENESWTKLNSIIQACTAMSLKTRLANASELNKALTREIEIEPKEDISSPKAISAESKSSELSIKIAEEQPWQT
jgi:serine/threonine-protein kinase